jgi:hypothetical protein
LQRRTGWRRRADGELSGRSISRAGRGRCGPFSPRKAAAQQSCWLRITAIRGLELRPKYGEAARSIPLRLMWVFSAPTALGWTAGRIFLAGRSDQQSAAPGPFNFECLRDPAAKPVGGCCPAWRLLRRSRAAPHLHCASAADPSGHAQQTGRGGLQSPVTRFTGATGLHPSG